MKIFYSICTITLATIALAACTSKEPPPLKSPCVGAEGSPCMKRDANPALYKTHPELKNQA